MKEVFEALDVPRMSPIVQPEGDNAAPVQQFSKEIAIVDHIGGK